MACAETGDSEVAKQLFELAKNSKLSFEINKYAHCGGRGRGGVEIPKWEGGKR